VCRIRPKREKVTGGWKELCYEELRGLYFSPDMIGVMKLRRVI